DQEIELGSGQVVVRSDGPTSGFTVRTPGAAFFDVGTEFALAVVDSVGTKMHVIEGEVIASLLSDDNVALDERSAFAGDFLTVDPYDGISEADLNAGEFPQMLAPSALPLDLPAAYVSAVMDAGPLGYWRFENLDGGTVANEIQANHPAIALGPLRLEGGDGGNRTAVFEGDESERGLFVADAFSKFSSGEYSVELWFNSQSLQHGGLVSLVEVDAESIDAAREDSREHRMMTLECTGGERSRWASAPQGKVSFAHRLLTGVTDRDKRVESGRDREKRGGRESRERRHKGGDHRHGSRDRTGGEKKGQGRSGGHSKSRRGRDSDRSHESEGGRFAAGYRDFESRVYSRSRYAPGSWHHLVAVRESDRISLYLDGELEETTQAAPGSDLMDLKVLVGRYSLTSGCLGRPFHGRIDELALYSRALSAAEIRKHAGLNK
ncbi:MAG: LamG domain-containing protein, partial [Verrucomicrobiales bacterium]